MYTKIVLSEFEVTISQEAFEELTFATVCTDSRAGSLSYLIFLHWGSAVGGPSSEGI